MNLLELLGKISALVPESQVKTLARSLAYSLFSLVSLGSELVVYRGRSFKMARYPLLGGTGCELTALNGYLGLCDISEGWTIVDCGAYSGDFTLYAALTAGERGRVLAFEPDLTGQRMLMRNLKLNHIRNVLLIKKGVWKEDGCMSVISAAYGTSITNQSRRYPQTVPVCSLDQELRRLGISKVDFIKMDIEGSEIEALKGARRTLMSVRCVAVASYHIREGIPTCHAVEEFLRGADLDVFTINAPTLTTVGLRRVR